MLFKVGPILVQDGVKLAEIQALDRLREPDEMADQLMLDAGMIFHFSSPQKTNSSMFTLSKIRESKPIP